MDIIPTDNCEERSGNLYHNKVKDPDESLHGNGRLEIRWAV